MPDGANIPSIIDQVAQFRDAMAAYGIPPDGPIETDTDDIIRFHVEGDRKGSTNGFYRIWTDGKVAGFFGSWKIAGGRVVVWTSGNTAHWSAEERHIHVARVKAARAAREQERAQKNAAAAIRAMSILERAAPLTETNAYLTEKGVAGHELLRVGDWPIEWTDKHGEVHEWIIPDALLIPIRDTAKNIVSVQAIWAKEPKDFGRTKDFLSGGRTQGCYFPIGRPAKDNANPVIVICEGYATGASIHAATGFAVLVAFHAGNLKHVARLVRKSFPKIRIVIAADDDRLTPGNPGVKQAIAAADAVKGAVAVVIPEFSAATLALPEYRGPDAKLPTDFNDLHALEGIDQVKLQIMAVLAPAQDVEPPTPMPAPGDPDRATPTSVLAFTGIKLPATADARDGVSGNLPLTELGNAGRLFKKHGQDIRYISDVGRWLIWDRDHWKWDADGAEARAMALGLPADIYNEGWSDLAQSEHYLKWSRNTQTLKTARATVAILEDYSPLRRPLASIDGDPMLVGLDGTRQVIDLCTGVARPARREDYITRCLGISRIGSADRAHRWNQFLDEVFQGDRELIGWLKRWVGYCLTGRTDEHIFLFAFGHGANGKSVFLSVLEALLGDYARTIQPESLMVQARQGSGATPDLARLAGARLVVGNETESGKALAESLVKQLVGGDIITARDLYAAFFEFKPVLKLILAGNHRPVIRGTDGGIWRRIRMVPFNRQFAPDERDTGLLAVLLAELPDIAAWGLDGCMEWQARGLGDVPVAIAAATQSYREEQDTLGQWIAEKTEPSGECRAIELFSNYRDWAASCALQPMSMQAFGRLLTERCLVKDKRRNGMFYIGISIPPI